MKLPSQPLVTTMTQLPSVTHPLPSIPSRPAMGSPEPPRYELLEQIGEGSAGRVFRGRRTSDQQEAGCGGWECLEQKIR